MPSSGEHDKHEFSVKFTLILINTFQSSCSDFAMPGRISIRTSRLMSGGEENGTAPFPIPPGSLQCVQTNLLVLPSR
jgi:hypothetical protein